ncbi:MAG: hypothetical protein IJA55_07310 [Clostridia bacterium]|nr:hypothetical protein [Clostridia bacterium]
MNYTLAELHCHTREVSGCAKVYAPDAIKHFHENGYDLVCLTNHYKRGIFRRHYENGEPYIDSLEVFLNAYRTAKEVGDSLGVTVLLAAEITFDSCYNDYLVYGLTEEQFYKYPKLHEMTVEQFSHFARQNGLFFAQAHPFRNENTIRTDPSLIDGCEIINSYENEDTQSIEWARENDLIPLCGQDYHRYVDMRGFKTAFHGEVRDIDTLKQKLFNREYSIIFDPKKQINTDKDNF